MTKGLGNSLGMTEKNFCVLKGSVIGEKETWVNVKWSQLWAGGGKYLASEVLRVSEKLNLTPSSLVTVKGWRRKILGIRSVAW